MLEILLRRAQCFFDGPIDFPPFSMWHGSNLLRTCRRCYRPTSECTAWTWFIVLCSGLLVFGALMAGCAHVQSSRSSCAPEVFESPIGDYVWWPFGDAGPKLLGVRNDCAAPVHVVVACPSSSSTGDGFDRWEVDVKANSEVDVLMQQGARDSLVQVCHRESWETKT